LLIAVYGQECEALAVAAPRTDRPGTDPDEQGLLDVGDGNAIYFETWGNSAGKPVVVLHGGPGSGCSSSLRLLFDLEVFRIVLFDQRGCGRSTPNASDMATDLAVNTTEHLLADIEALRRHLGVPRWLVFGMSWGSTLGLAYAERHPGRVTEIILAGVTTTTRTEIEWLYRGVSRLFPAQWERFMAGIPEDRRDADVIEAYHRLLNDPDPEVRDSAARHWSDWEWATASVDPGTSPDARWSDPVFRLARARIVTHYFTHDAWLDQGVLLREAGALAAIPGVMVHGRLDLGSPLATAWELHRAWPASELVVVAGAGHALSEPGMAEAVMAAAQRFASPSGGGR
jgi:proline iminopeptidase